MTGESWEALLPKLVGTELRLKLCKRCARFRLTNKATLEQGEEAEEWFLAPE